MRHSGKWMTSLDDRILEFLHENKPTTPTRMTTEASLPYSRQHVDRRCKKLDEEGLLESLGNGVYMITEDGEAYLKGHLDTEHWKYIDEDGEDAHDDLAEDTGTDS
ncbi:MarR family transcriptional regulator [Halorubrum ezzemoulense]|uniref:MarR family transcriptional regulator n=1 Tax=Halorubrum ezzemoulense TaxID=337243 RepID=UPI00232B96C4|nr:MarR family transcriptional regulator [Halorubrum ezzemoulense]MDB9285113.1 MarR family transcriptional regulator [Halorubrum ezzemoulense]